MNNLSPPAATANADGDIPSEISEGSVRLVWPNSGRHTSEGASDVLAGGTAPSSGARSGPGWSAAALAPVLQEAATAIKTASPPEGIPARIRLPPDHPKPCCFVLMTFY